MIAKCRLNEETVGNRVGSFLTSLFAVIYFVKMITTVTENNQVTLPAEIVRLMELEPGAQVEWMVGPERTLIGKPLREHAERAAVLLGAGRKYLRPGSDPIGDLLAERAQDDEPTHKP